MTPEAWKALAAKYPAREIWNCNVRTCVVRLSYANLFKAVLFKGNGTGAADANAKPRFSVTCLLPEGDNAMVLEAACKEVLKGQFQNAKFGAPSGGKITVEFDAGGKRTRKQVDWPIFDQGIRDTDGYVPGSLAVAANAYTKPDLLGTDNKPVTDETALYSGAYGIVVLRPYWSKGWGRLCIGLQAVRKVADGERFGGGSLDRDAAFGDIDELAGFDLEAMLA